MRWNLLLVSLALSVGCGGRHASFTGMPGSDAALGTGKILIDWTLGGDPPSKAACAAIDHLDLNLASGWGEITISPVPCTLTRFRYDGLPDGPGTLTMNAYDPRGCAIARGSVDLTVGDTLPGAPSPTVAIGAVQPCN